MAVSTKAAFRGVNEGGAPLEPIQFVGVALIVDVVFVVVTVVIVVIVAIVVVSVSLYRTLGAGVGRRLLLPVLGPNKREILSSWTAG